MSWMNRYPRLMKCMSLVSGFSILSGIGAPQRAHALTSGPTQPEVSSFKQIDASGMVDPFTGDFSFSIPVFELPGPDGGYPFNLVYNAGVGMDQEASWVGLGWNLNPGSVSRQMRGIPDDFSASPGEEVKMRRDIKPNTSYGFDTKFDMELFGAESGLLDAGKSVLETGVGLDINLGIEHNSYAGWDLTVGAGPSINVTKLGESIKSGTPASETLTFGDRSVLGKFGLTVNLSSQNGASLNGSVSGRFSKHRSINFSAGGGRLSLGLELGIPQVHRNLDLDFRANMVSGFAGRTPSAPLLMSSVNTTLTVKLGVKAPGIFGSMPLKGRFSKSFLLKEVQAFPGLGYMHNHTAVAGEAGFLRDINREKDVPVGARSKNIGLPVATQDVYTVTGHGVSGTFRSLFPGMSLFSDPPQRAISSGVSLGVDLGAGVIAKTGASIGRNFSTSSHKAWENVFYRMLKKENEAKGTFFKSSSGLSAVSKADFGAFGGDAPLFLSAGSRDLPDLAALASATASDVLEAVMHGWAKVEPEGVRLAGKAGAGPKLADLSSGIGYGQAEALQMFTNADAAGAGGIFGVSYYEGSALKVLDRAVLPQGQAGAMVSLSPDGTRHVYALPAYNNSQKEVSFSADRPKDEKDAEGRIVAEGKYARRADIPSGEDFYKIKNTDEYLEEKNIPRYAHSHLLTSVLGASYVDSDGVPGPSAGDLGYWVKFTYVKSSGSYKWRAPFYGANYSEGDENDYADNKASYTYGEKEIWYLKSAETKTHLAVFETSARHDGFGALEELQNTAKSGTEALQRLDAAYLFSKNGLDVGLAIADPKSQQAIKVALFSYEPAPGQRELCPGADNTPLNRGKLTLFSLSFKHGKNSRGLLTPYLFRYHDAITPGGSPIAYHPGNTDRWGSYQDYAGDLEKEAHFPYTFQKATGLDKAKRDAWASAWNLSGVTYPSGGELEVLYESDDYAWVQDSPATSMIKLAGLGAGKSPSVGETAGAGCRVYFELESPVAPPADGSKVVDAYLGDMAAVYFKLKSSAGGQWLRTSLYAELSVNGRGLDEASKDADGKYTTGYFTIKSVPSRPGSDKYYHPFEVAAWRHIDQNQPQTAAYMKDVLDGVGMGDGTDKNENKRMIKTVKSLANPGLFGGLAKFLKGKDGWYKARRYGENISLEASFARLQSPSGRKYGGGHRVRRVLQRDNWGDGTVYGQNYSYTALDGSSSGVASYEPLFGGDEISLRRVEKMPDSRFLSKVSDDLFFEFPVNESYYPAPVVGYSRVAVRSLASDVLAGGEAVDGGNFPDAPFGGTGEAVHEFYTARDFPVKSRSSDLGGGLLGASSGRGRLKFNLKIPLLGALSVDYLSLSQGYVVELNDMHGKPKSLAYYPQDKNGKVSGKEVSSVRYSYRLLRGGGLDNGVPVMFPDGKGGVRVDRSGHVLGVDLELIGDSRSNGSFSSDVSLSFDVDTEFALIPLPFPNVWPKIQLSATSLKTFSTNRIVRRVGILESVTATDGLSRVETRNHLWDAGTGNPVLTSVTNKFGDPVYTFTMPAYYQYPGMGAAFPEYRAVCKGVALSPSGAWKLYSTVSPAVHRGLSAGAEVLFKGEGGTRYVGILARKDYAGKDGADRSYFEFPSGVPDLSKEYELTVLRPGGRNQLYAPSGSVTYLALNADGTRCTDKDAIGYLEWVVANKKSKEINKELPAAASNY